MSKNQLFILFIFIFISPFVYFGFVHQDSHNFKNVFNFIIFILSFFLVFYSLLSFKKNGILTHNLFLFTFYIFLFWNTSNLGGIQLKKDALDVYYYFFGPILFAIILFFADSIKIVDFTLLTNYKISPNSLAFILLAIFIFVKLYIGSIVGYRIESVEAGFLEDGDKYSVPGFTGLATVMQWTLVMLIPHIKKKYAILIVLIIVIFAILHVKRGDISRLFIFLIVYYFYLKAKIKNFFSFKKIVIISSIFISFAYIFAGFGEWRRSNQLAESVIKRYLDSNSDNIVLNWMYSYTTISYDVMKICTEMKHPYYPYALVYPYLDQSSTDLKNYLKEQEKANINGFNAGTFLSMFIHDFGVFYIIDILLFGLFVALITIIARMFSFFGIYCMILTLLVFSFFGNNFINIGIINSFVFAIILFNFINLEKKIVL